MHDLQHITQLMSDDVTRNDGDETPTDIMHRITHE